MRSASRIDVTAVGACREVDLGESADRHVHTHGDGTCPISTYAVDRLAPVGSGRVQATFAVTGPVVRVRLNFARSMLPIQRLQKQIRLWSLIDQAPVSASIQQVCACGDEPALTVVE